jgi:aryl-alcohol dehydrogenase-like predicted oxidoreductase
LRVSVAGLGCNRLGEPSLAERRWVALASRAADQGVNIFDTSDSYNTTRSETILGKAFGHREDVYIATKFSGFGGSCRKDLTIAAMEKSVEGSLRRLRRDCIDIYQLHSPRLEDLQRSDWYEGMARMVDAGKIRCSAVALRNLSDGLWIIKNCSVDVLQVTYNLLEPEAEEALFAMAREHGVGLLVRKPYQRGALTGKFVPGRKLPDGHRALLEGDRLGTHLRRAELFRPLAMSRTGGMLGLALQYCLGPEAVSTVIPGARSEEQLGANIQAANAPELSKLEYDEIGRIQRSWLAEVA